MYTYKNSVIFFIIRKWGIPQNHPWSFIGVTMNSKIHKAVLSSLGCLMLIISVGIVTVKSQGIKGTIDTQESCLASPLTNFLFLPYDTGVYGDWMLKMTAAFDHHYPDYSCSVTGLNQTCLNRGLEIRLWEGEVARPIYNNGIPLCFAPGSDSGILSSSYCGWISGYEGATGESIIYYDGHDGYDWALAGDFVSILSSASGRIESVQLEGDFGWTVTVDHLNGYKTKYSHLQTNQQNLPIGSCVQAGQQIGVQGSTGKSTGNHLHYRVFHNGKITDPFGYCFYCEGDPIDPLISFNGESSSNLWYGTNPRSVGRAPTRSDISIIWSAFSSMYIGGPGIMAPVSDTIAPTGYFTSPSNGSIITSPSVNITVNATDNIGGSGVKEVRFSAKWGDSWHDIGADSSSPYGITWDMCTYGVPNGDVELGMEVWDNANNKWVYSEHFSNPHISKNYDCSGSGLPSVNQWHAEAWMNKSLAGYVNHDEYWPAGVTNVAYPFIGFERDWGDGAPYVGFPSNEFSFKVYSNLYFNGGHYNFRVCTDDGVVLEIDGQKVIDEWWDRGGCLQTDKWLDNKFHTIEIRYFENQGSAYLKLYIWGEEYPRPELDDPDGRITLPTNNGYISQNPMQIWADAWDDVSGIDYVKFKVYHCIGGCFWRVIGFDYAPPYQIDNWNWTELNGQQIKLAIDVFDNSGRSRENAGGEITVNLDNTMPSITFISPVSGSIDEDKLVNLSVSASDIGSGVSRINFFVGYEDGVNYWHAIGSDSDSSNGWGLIWDGSGLPDGTVVGFFAIAYDRAGNSSSVIIDNITIGPRFLKKIFLPIVWKAQSFSPTPTPSLVPTRTPLPTSTPIGGGQGKVAFVSFPNVFLMDVYGYEQSRLVYTYDGQYHPHWSPDNQYIILSAKTRYETCGIYQCAIWDIVKVKADGSQTVNLTYGYSGDNGHPTYSPNGQKIAFIAGLGGTSGDLVLMDQNGANKFATSVSDANFPEWSPLSNKIVYCAPWGSCTNIKLYDVNSNTSSHLLSGEFGGAMSWSPDGQYIAFSMKVNDTFEIYIIKSDGSGLQRITTNSSNDLSPSWSPDGNWIVFTSDRDGNSEIYRMKKDGTIQTRITNNTTTEWWPDWSN